MAYYEPYKIDFTDYAMAALKDALDASSNASNKSKNISGGTTMFDKKNSETGERLDEIAEEIVSLASDVPGVDLSRVTRAVERVSEEHKERIERALRGIADLEQLKTQRRAKQFVVAYWYNGKEGVAHGVEFLAHRDGDGKLQASQIHIDDYGTPLSARYWDMDALKKSLSDQKIIHHIAYLDK